MHFSPEVYQVSATEHLLHHDIAALFTGMGLGKTSAALAAIDQLTISGRTSGFLIVAPLRVANITWPQEVSKWAQFRWLKVANLRTPQGWADMLARRAHVYVCNYEMLPKLVEQYLSKVPTSRWAFDSAVFDETTKAKNPSSKRINGARPYFMKLQRRWGLTGTPSPNSFLELYAQIRLLDGGERLGKSFHQFRQCYFEALDWNQYDWKPRTDSIEKITARISDIVLTQKTSDFSKLADIEVVDIECPLPPEVCEQYKTLEKDLLLRFAEEDVVADNAAVLANKLLQFTGGHVYSEEKETIVLHKTKIEALQKLAKKVHPLLIATNYQHEQESVAAALPGCVRFDSAKTPRAQDELVAKWNRKEIPYLVADPRSIGHGLNLQEGGKAICWYSPNWSNELYDQLNCRLQRKGQTEQVTVYHLLCPNTVDDAVMEGLVTRGNNQRELMTVLTNLQQLRKVG